MTNSRIRTSLRSARTAAEYRAHAEPSTIVGLAAALSAASRDLARLKADGRDREARGAMAFRIAGAVELASIPAGTEEEAHIKLTLLEAIVFEEPPGDADRNAAAMIAAAIRHERAR